MYGCDRLYKNQVKADEELPLKKTIEIPSMAVVVRAFIHESNKYYPQIFLPV